MCSCLTKSPTQEDVWFRAARKDDLGAVVRLLEETGLTTEGLDTWFGDSYRIAEAAGAIVGVAGIEVFPPYGLLRSVAVHPRWRGRGVAARLVAERIEWARAQGLVSLSLLTTSAPDYFRRFGFRPAERAESPRALHASAELKACPESATFMERRLEGGEEGLGLIEAIRERYAEAARNAASGRRASCADAGEECCGDVVTGDLYLRSQAEEIPEEALQASLGCGNPTLLASLQPGEIVLDLGSGGGIDVLLSARRVGPEGKAYGLDMTDEMLALARANQQRAGITNVEFLKGRIEDIPLPDGSVDVVVSNCVLNLSTDKPRAFREAFRVLKPGGRLAVSDIVVRGDVPAALRRSVELWVGCVAGALEEREYVRHLAEAGFEEIEVQPTRIYTADDARPFLESVGLPASLAQELDGRFMSAFIRGKHPQN